MRIAFVGKGGSGKTTLTALCARYLAARHLPVLVIDADINQHLATTLGMLASSAASLPPLGIEISRMKQYLKGENPRITSLGTMIKTTPPGSGSRFLRFGEKNPIFDYFERRHEDVRIMAAGEFTQEDLGTKCYHSKVGAVELLLNHLIDQEREYVLVDMTAGADSFASGMFTKFDLTVLVVEPTMKSVSVYEQYRTYAQQYDISIRVIGNKVENDCDVDFLRHKIGQALVAVMFHSPYVRSSEKGAYLPIDQLEKQNIDALGTIVRIADGYKKDWKKFYGHAIDFHKKNAFAWANASVGEDVTHQIDPMFDIEKSFL